MNTLIEIKNAEIIKNKKSTPRQKELLDLFSNLLVTILTDKTLKSEVKKMKTKMKMIKMKMKMKNMMMMKQWVKTKKYIIIKNKNDVLDEIIDKSKSFEKRIKSLKKLKGLKGYWPYNDYGVKI